MVHHAVQVAATIVPVLHGASFPVPPKLLEVIYGPFLVDRGFDKATIGWFSLGPMIGAMILGSVLGGWLADRFGRRRCVAGSLSYIVLTIVGLAVSDLLSGSEGGWHLFPWLTATAFGIGLFTTSSYALFMDFNRPAIAATQFSAFMRATNGCGREPERHVEVTPAIVVEILSDSTRQRDFVHKRSIYQQQSVPTYLIVDAEASQLTALKLNADGQYVEADCTDSLAIEICDDCRSQVNFAGLFR